MSVCPPVRRVLGQIAAFSWAFAAFHKASISSSVASPSRRPAAASSAFDETEATFEFRIGAAHGRFRIDLDMAGEIGDGKQQVADFGFHCGLVCGREFRLDFGDLLADFRQNLPRIVPVEADFCGLGLELDGAGETGKRRRHASEISRFCGIGAPCEGPLGLPCGLFLRLDLRPTFARRPRAADRVRSRRRADAGAAFWR